MVLINFGSENSKLRLVCTMILNSYSKIDFCKLILRSVALPKVFIYWLNANGNRVGDYFQIISLAQFRKLATLLKLEKNAGNQFLWWLRHYDNTWNFCIIIWSVDDLTATIGLITCTGCPSKTTPLLYYHRKSFSNFKILSRLLSFLITF